MKQDEGENEIVLLVVDETYGHGEDTYEDDSERYWKGLEEEFKVTFKPANIGPGADLPAFLTYIVTTDIPLWTVALGTFLLGKQINESLNAWNEIGGRIRRFFGRPVVLSRNGAAVLAVEAVFAEMGGIPKTIRLLSYRPEYNILDLDLKALPSNSEIATTPPTLNLSMLTHVFEIEADGIKFCVSVDGKDTDLIQIQ